MNISDEQLDRMIAEAKHDRNICVGVYDVPALLHILETYRDMPKTRDGVRVNSDDPVWAIDSGGRILGCHVSTLVLLTGDAVCNSYSTRQAAEAAKARGK
jgi:hypothetical protein